MSGKTKISKGFKSLLNRNKGDKGVSSSSAQAEQNPFANAPKDTPEGATLAAIEVFCSSRGDPSAGDEVAQLPTIVDNAESSPSAAQAAAQQIRIYLTKTYSSTPSVQYNAVMLLRILCDNPGERFTRYFDTGFINTIRECLMYCGDNGTQQILRETLDKLEVGDRYKEGVEPLVKMWRKEKGGQGRLSSRAGGSAVMAPSIPSQRPQANRLPPPEELYSRVEEARNSAKILLQLLNSTPQEEVLTHELLSEFGTRCKSAQADMQRFTGATDPEPDNETMMTLIETSEQLSLAGTRYQRAIVSAKRAAGVSSPRAEESANSTTMSSPLLGTDATSPPPQSGANGVSAFAPPPPPQTTTYASYQSPPSNSASAFAPPTQRTPSGDLLSFGDPSPPANPPNTQQQSTSAFAPAPSAPKASAAYATEETYSPPPGPPPGRASLTSSSPPPPQQQQPTSNFDNLFAGLSVNNTTLDSPQHGTTSSQQRTYQSQPSPPHEKQQHHAGSYTGAPSSQAYGGNSQSYGDSQSYGASYSYGGSQAYDRPQTPPPATNSNLHPTNPFADPSASGSNTTPKKGSNPFYN